MGRLPKQMRKMEQGLALFLVVALLFSPLAYVIHLIAEPHYYCPVHLRFEADPSGSNERPRPANPRDHDDEDSPCLIATTHASEEGSSPLAIVAECPAPPAHLLRVASQVPALALCVLTQAPKQSPPSLLV